MFDRLSEITLALAKKGGGGGGSTNYNDLDHLPQINSVELKGNKSLADLGIKSAIDASQNASLQILEDTVGWTGKNKLIISLDKLKALNTNGSWSGNVYSRNGADFTCVVDSDGYIESITVNTQTSASADITFTLVPYAQYTGEYTLTGCPSGGSSSTYRLRARASVSGDFNDYGSGVTFTPNSSNNYLFEILIKSGATVSNKTFYPMLRLPNTSSDYEAGHDSVENVLQDAEVTPSKNLIPLTLDNIKRLNPASSQRVWNGNSFTMFSTTVTFATNANGSITSIDVNGTVTATSTGLFIDLCDLMTINSALKLNGCPSGGASQTYKLCAINSSGSALSGVPQDTGNGAELGTISGQFRIQLRVYNGITANHLTFKPMLYDASETDPTYKPYYVPLKDRVDEKANNSALAPVIDQDTAPRNIAQGEHFMHYGDFCTAKTAIASGATLTENSNYTVGDVGSYLQNIVTSATLGSGASDIGVTLDSSDSNKRVARYGNIVQFRVRISVANTVTLDEDKLIINLGYNPVISNPRCVQITTITSPNYEPMAVAPFIDSSGRIVFKKNFELTSGNYDISGTYICS